MGLGYSVQHEMGYLFLDPMFLWRVIGVRIVGLFIEDGVDQS